MGYYFITGDTIQAKTKRPRADWETIFFCNNPKPVGRENFIQWLEAESLYCEANKAATILLHTGLNYGHHYIRLCDLLDDIPPGVYVLLIDAKADEAVLSPIEL